MPQFFIAPQEGIDMHSLIGTGRMGGDKVWRLLRNSYTCVVIIRGDCNEQ